MVGFILSTWQSICILVGNKEYENIMPDKKIKLLIVDDIETNRTVLQMMCENMGYKCDLAGSGKETLKILEKQTYDMILLDCQMPLMDGYELASRIRQLKTESADTPIIAVTAYVHTENKEKCLAAGMNDFLPKPIRRRDIKLMVEKWTETEGPQNKAKPLQFKFNNEELKNYTFMDDSYLENAIEKQELPILVQLFTETVESKLASLDKYIQEKDENNIAILGIGLESNFKSIGAIALSEISSRIELAAKDKKFKQIEELYELIKQEFVRLNKYLMDKLNNQ